MHPHSFGPSENSLLQEFIHPQLHEPVECWGKKYILLEERQLIYQGQKVLYFLGIASVESSCCGPTGWAFIKVPGYIRSWKNKITEKGELLSEIEPITAPETKREIAKILLDKHPEFKQIEFI